ncbi:MAG: MAPEG family protein [Pseudomonadota bacterium]|jgi:uncharacterized MAPEG superfamily protein
MPLIDLVALIALLQFFLFAVRVGRARIRYGIQAPATSGHEMFERAYRVQMNTLELLVLFIPALYIAAAYWPQTPVAACGAVYLLGRAVYQRAYMEAPEARGLGFLLSIGPCLVLMLAALVGAVRAAAGA